MPLPHLFGWATVLVELAGGLLILLAALAPICLGDAGPLSIDQHLTKRRR
jgi:hypothetical protein